MCVTRPNRVHTITARTFVSEGFNVRVAPVRRLLDYMLNEQFTWQPPFMLQDWPGFAWRTQERQAVKGQNAGNMLIHKAYKYGNAVAVHS